MYESEPKVRRIVEVKSKDTKSSETTNTDINTNSNVKHAGKPRTNKNRRKSSSTHARSKNNSTSSSNSPPSSCSISNHITAENKVDTKIPLKPVNSKSKDVKSHNVQSPENENQAGKERYLS